MTASFNLSQWVKKSALASGVPLVVADTKVIQSTASLLAQAKRTPPTDIKAA